MPQLNREIDVQIAEKVMGWKTRRARNMVHEYHQYAHININYGNEVWLDLPHFSTNMNDAWRIIDKLKEKYNSIEIVAIKDIVYVIITERFEGGKIKDRYQDYHLTAPLAICKAALKAVENNK